MDHKEKIKIQIEQLRKEMYEAYENRADYDILVETSEKLDQLLNELETQKKS